MQIHLLSRFVVGLTATIPWLLLSAVAAQNPAPAPAAGTNSVTQQEVPKSVFVAQGRNPFFPNSAPPTPPLDQWGGGKSPSPAPSFLLLNGITSPPKRTAIINNRTFEAEESGEIKAPDGSKVLIKCQEIGDDFATILYNGQRIILKMRPGF